MLRDEINNNESFANLKNAVRTERVFELIETQIATLRLRRDTIDAMAPGSSKDAVILEFNGVVNGVLSVVSILFDSPSVPYKTTVEALYIEFESYSEVSLAGENIH